jgi:hypothetical protein
VVNGASTNVLVQDNAIARTQEAGILVEPCCGDDPDRPTGVRVAGNALTATADGIVLFESDSDVVTRNSITRAGTFGDPQSFGVGVLLDGVSDALVSRNAIADSGRGFGPGIVIGVPPEFGASPRPVTANLVVRNTVSGQRADGILVAPRRSASRRCPASPTAAATTPMTTATRRSAPGSPARRRHGGADSPGQPAPPTTWTIDSAWAGMPRGHAESRVAHHALVSNGVSNQPGIPDG